MLLELQLLNNPKFASAGECTIVLNGKFITRSSSLVYAKNKNGNLIFYTKATGDKDGIHTQILDNCAIQILNKMNSTSFCGVDLGFSIPVTEDNFTLEIDTTLHIIFIQTSLYQKVRELIAQKNYTNVTLSFSKINKVIDSATVLTIVNAFKHEAYSNYLSVAYSNKFLNKVFKTPGYSFYSLLKCFVPVLVECKYLYNPFTDNDSFSIKDKQIYKMAEEKDRIVEVLPDGILTVSLLTHLEICQALGMSRMMRFTPQFLYKMIAGFLIQRDPEFPSTETTVLIKPSSASLDTSIKKWYTPLAYNRRIKELKQQYEETSDTQEKMKISTSLSALSAYTETDSLYAHIKNDYTKLVHYGISALDSSENTSVEKLYEYLKVAKLL